MKARKKSVRKSATKEKEELLPKTPRPDGLVSFFAKSPLAKNGRRLKLTRKPDYGRDIDL
jgi:hypothetical protein